MNVYDTITARIMDQLEQGTIPWQQPWNSTTGLPCNLLSQKAYRGINVWLLGSAGYASPYWLTYKQAREIGGHVNKGEHGTPVLFWKWLDTKEEEHGEDASTRQPKHVPVARMYTVFNVYQCELPARLQPLLTPENTQETAEHQKIAECEQILASMPQRPAIEHREARAYYRPSSDMVNMPAPELFTQAAAYYSTLFHELTHSTGHTSRLDRPTLKDLLAFGDTNYSKEELCAEMGAAYLCGVAGIANATVDNSAAYIQGWLGRLRNDTKLLVQAAAQAQKAADFILGMNEQ